ncbi:hypothetical protein ULMS_14210 [Patiriisocius marinistellae]|uniref:Molecular chaperone DnaK n=1 Tax=Patiriisocius marinistellae TaxID=2494560 RepID=A0A5J4FVH6_9FLAO|nr:DUF4331 family protein [Patiriisocius marinistellae]GEQ85913.1 hypothetical protein ULMS_14210 [Patiriisocius marinistellae]
MKRTKIIAAIGMVGIAVSSVFLLSADHVDAPQVEGTKSDIADLYAFEGDNPNNTVFIATIQGPLASGQQTANAQFDEDVLIEFNIDNTGDFVEDLVIQAIRRGDSMYFFGPAAPAETGLESTVNTFAARTAVKISTGEEVEVTTANSLNVYAGPRRDPFYFDFNRFNLVASGSVAPEGFLPSGEASDFFEDLNVLSVAVEVPNSMLGTAPTHVAVAAEILPPGGAPNAYNVWVSTKRKSN